MRRAFVAGAALVLAGACAAADDDAAPPTTTIPDVSLRLNEIQVLGTHNSYHLQPEPALFDALRAFSPVLADSIEYSHAPLEVQFDEQGIRQIELDVFADPEGGLYADRVGPTLVGLPGASGDPALDQPGFKVMHVQDVDFRSTCSTLVACITIVREWSLEHPSHVPILVLVEVKQDPVPGPDNLGFVVPHPIGAAELDALDAEIRSVFDADQLLTPDDVRGERASLEEVVLDGGWPALDDVRGRVMFALDNEDEVRDAYVAGHEALAGRVLFTSSPRGTPEAAFLKLNDAVGDGDTIRQAVLDGYVVRTRADADTAQARSGDTTVLEAALDSGAQWISTDYPVSDERLGTSYVAAIPGGTPGRCNPLVAPPACRSEDVEDPATL